MFFPVMGLARSETKHSPRLQGNTQTHTETHTYAHKHIKLISITSISARVNNWKEYDIYVDVHYFNICACKKYTDGK